VLVSAGLSHPWWPAGQVVRQPSSVHVTLLGLALLDELVAQDGIVNAFLHFLLILYTDSQVGFWYLHDYLPRHLH
jgi:hypothetical protein